MGVRGGSTVKKKHFDKADGLDVALDTRDLGVDIWMEMKMDRQLFVLEPEIWSSIDRDVVESTCDALEELNIFEPPFEEFDLKVSIRETDFEKFFKLSDRKLPGNKTNEIKSRTIRYKVKKIDKKIMFHYKLKARDQFINREDIEKYTNCKIHAEDFFSDLFFSALIALLATKNVEKHTEIVKKHGVKSQKRPREYKYVTTIKIGKITETLRSNATSRGPVRAHLRRGHIRNQRCGEGFKEVKQVFIQPVFVNADDGWIENQRKEYRIKV